MEQLFIKFLANIFKHGMKDEKKVQLLRGLFLSFFFFNVVYLLCWKKDLRTKWEKKPYFLSPCYVPLVLTYVISHMQHIQLGSKYYYSHFLEEEAPNQKAQVICRRAENQWKRWDCRPESKASAFHTTPSYSSWGFLVLIRPYPSSLVMTSVILFIEVKYTHRKVLVPYRYSLMDFFTDWHISKQVSSQIKTQRINTIPQSPLTFQPSWEPPHPG